LNFTDPRSKGADRLITSEPTLDLGSVVDRARFKRSRHYNWS